jgi:hypothetical protein
MVDALRPLNEQNATQQTKSPAANTKQTGHKPAPEKKPSVQPAKPAPEEKLTAAQLAKLAEKKLYLLAPSRPHLETIKALCRRFPGNVPVTVKLSDENIALLLETALWCDGSEKLLAAFRDLFGGDHVVLKG